MRFFDHKVYIQVDHCRYNPEYLYFNGKPVIIRMHVIQRAEERGILYPDQVLQVVNEGKVKRFGKRGIKFVKQSREGSIVCVGEETSQTVTIKTIEYGN